MSEVKVNKISPSSGTAFTIGDSGDTFTVPSGATIVNSGTATGFGGGKIGQVLTVQNLDVESTTSTSFATISDLSRAITPAASSSKILVISSLETAHSPNHLLYRLMRDTTAIGVGDASGSTTPCSFSMYEGGSSEGMACWSHSFTWLDSPSTTSEVVYSWDWRTDSGTTYLNRSEDSSDHANYPRCASSITCLEVLA